MVSSCVVEIAVIINMAVWKQSKREVMLIESSDGSDEFIKLVGVMPLYYSFLEIFLFVLKCWKNSVFIALSQP
jgi:hypothetical protein